MQIVEKNLNSLSLSPPLSVGVCLKIKMWLPFLNRCTTVIPFLFCPIYSYFAQNLGPELQCLLKVKQVLS